MISFIKLTENDKRLIIMLLLVIILLFVLIGCLSLFVKKIMTFQAKKADDMLHDVVKSGLITTESKLRKFGVKKNWRVLFKQAAIPMIILGAAWLLFLGYGILFKDGDFGAIDIFGYESEEGFGTLFFVHDWANAEKQNVWGINMYTGFPEVLNSPHFSIKAWFSYIFVPANAVGLVWLLVTVQAYIARSFRIIKLSKTIFKKTLEKPASLDSGI